MKTATIRHLSASALLCCLSMGCVRYTKINDEPRREVSFSSTPTAQTFYDAYAGVGSVKVKDGKKRSIKAYIWFPLPYWQNTVKSENVKFNEAIQSADADHNGVVSQKEARAYQQGIEDAEKAAVSSADCG